MKKTMTTLLTLLFPALIFADSNTYNFASTSSSAIQSSTHKSSSTNRYSLEFLEKNERKYQFLESHLTNNTTNSSIIKSVENKLKGYIHGGAFREDLAEILENLGELSNQELQSIASDDLLNALLLLSMQSQAPDHVRKVPLQVRSSCKYMIDTQRGKHFSNLLNDPTKFACLPIQKELILSNQSVLALALKELSSISEQKDIPLSDFKEVVAKLSPTINQDRLRKVGISDCRPYFFQREGFSQYSGRKGKKESFDYSQESTQRVCKTSSDHCKEIPRSAKRVSTKKIHDGVTRRVSDPDFTYCASPGFAHAGEGMLFDSDPNCGYVNEVVVPPTYFSTYAVIFVGMPKGCGPLPTSYEFDPQRLDTDVKK